MRSALPSIQYPRPPFWPWLPGQDITLAADDLSWLQTVSHEHLLFAWWQLGGDHGPLDATAFLRSMSCKNIDDDASWWALQTLQRLHLVVFCATCTAWIRQDPLQPHRAPCPYTPPPTVASMDRLDREVWLLCAHPQSRFSWSHRRVHAHSAFIARHKELLERGFLAWRDGELVRTGGVGARGDRPADSPRADAALPADAQTQGDPPTPR